MIRFLLVVPVCVSWNWIKLDKTCWIQSHLVAHTFLAENSTFEWHARPALMSIQLIYDDTIPGLVWIIPILRILISNHDVVFRYFFLLILEGYNVKVDQHVLFPVGLGIYIYIYIVPSGIRLPHFDFESYENRWNQFMCIWIHDDSWARIYRSLYNYTYIYIIFPAINLHLVRGFPSHLWWPVSL